MLKEFVAGHPQARMADNLGTQGYFNLMSKAAAMVGNSSSGIIEAPSFQLPVVNIGTRQEGRVKAANVIDVGYSREEVLGGYPKGPGSSVPRQPPRHGQPLRPRQCREDYRRAVVGR